jgi:hypothetical protein
LGDRQTSESKPLPAAHPAWAEELRRRYLRGEASQFILYGNVFDLVPYGSELLPVRSSSTPRPSPPRPTRR